MTLNGHFALNFVLRRYVWSSEAWKLVANVVGGTLNRKEQLRYRATAHIRTEFAARTKNNFPDTILPSDFIFDKSKVAAAAILNFKLNLFNGYN